MGKYCMVIDLKRCVGCNGCVTICKAEHGTPPGVLRSKVMKAEFGKFPNVNRVSLPMLCMHCDNAPCIEACPTGATYKNEDGIVVMNKELCVGCKACMTACPYGARSMREDANGYFGPRLTPYEERMYKAMPLNCIDKCDFCVKNRLAKGEDPACVTNCSATARIFGIKEDLMGLVNRRKGYRLRDDLGTEPSVYFLP